LKSCERTAIFRRENDWIIEKGKYRIFAGKSSKKLSLKENIETG
jgi:hypothetical protein